MENPDELHTCLSEFLSSIECSELVVKGFIENENLYQRLKNRLKAHGIKFSTRTERKTKFQPGETNADTHGGRFMFLNDKTVYSGHVYCVEKTSYKQCCRGPHYYKNKKLLPVPDRAPSKRKRSVQDTIKQNCPAYMTVRRTRIFVKYKLPLGVSSWRQKKKLLESCQGDIEAKTIMRYEVEISKACVHNHPLELVSPKKKLRLLPEVVEPIPIDSFDIVTEDSLEVARKQDAFRELCQQLMSKSYQCFDEKNLDDIISEMKIVNSNLDVITDHYT